MLSRKDRSLSAFPKAGDAGLALTIGMYNDAVQYDCKYGVHVRQHTGIGTLTCFALAEGLADL